MIMYLKYTCFCNGEAQIGPLEYLKVKGLLLSVNSGALTHSVKALDISLNVDTELAVEVGKRTKRA